MEREKPTKTQVAAVDALREAIRVFNIAYDRVRQELGADVTARIAIDLVDQERNDVRNESTGIIEPSWH